MGDMKKLAELVKELQGRLAVCMRCGLCRSVCPIFAQTGREPDVARGKLALLDGIIEGVFRGPRGVNDQLRRCLLCGACGANCPSGVKTLELFLKARALLAGYLKLSPLKRLLFRALLPHPKVFDRLLEWGSGLQGIFLKPVDDFQETSCGRVPSPLSGRRRLKAPALVPFHRRVSSLDRPAGKSGLRVGFFVGCLIDKVFPNVAEAILEALEKHGVGVFLPGDLGCCGIPALSAGDATAFGRLVRHNLEKLTSEPFDFLVTGCATCTATIRNLWPVLYPDIEDGKRAQVRALAAKTLDISQFLADKAGPLHGTGPTSGDAVPLAYHDPCHLAKSLGVTAQPRALLRANGLYRFEEMAEADECCGCGGSFNLEHYDLSASIGRRKRENIARSGCKTVATGCPACMLQLSDMLSQAGDRIRVKHAVEIYAEVLRP